MHPSQDDTRKLATSHYREASWCYLALLLSRQVMDSAPLNGMLRLKWVVVCDLNCSGFGAGVEGTVTRLVFNFVALVHLTCGFSMGK